MKSTECSGLPIVGFSQAPSPAWRNASKDFQKGQGSMISFSPSEDQLAFRKMAEDFANNELKPNAIEWDEKLEFARRFETAKLWP